MTQETTSQAPGEPIEIQERAELQERAAEFDVVLADFYADWCGPCQMMEPVLDTIAAETDAAVVKVDVDRFQQLAAEYGVQGVPTMVVFADGEPVERLVGATNEQQLRDVVATYTA